MSTDKKEKAGLFIDASNFHYALNKKEWNINFKKFLDYFKSSYDISCAYYYSGIISKQAYFVKHPEKKLNDFIKEKEKKIKYFDLLKSFGYKIVKKNLHQIYDDSIGEYKLKCNFDVELTIDAIDNCDKYKVFILASGDGDFVKLIKYLKFKNKRTVIISAKDRLNHILKKVANKTIYLNDIKQFIVHYKKRKLD